MKPKLSVIKIGGHVIENKRELATFLTLFSEHSDPKILIHGGGKLASELSIKLGMEPKMIGGRRITDTETLEVITMVYGGLANKKIVAQLQAHGCNAIGISGADANTLQAHKRPVKEIDYGFAGDIDTVNGEVIKALLQIGLVPVFCALTHDGKGQLLNTNADTIAAEIAISMSGFYDTTLYYCFEKKGVLRDILDEDSVLKHIDTKSYTKLLREGVIADGMLPKLENCFHALHKNVRQVCLGNMDMLDAKATLFTTLTL